MKLFFWGGALVLLHLTILHAPAVADDGYWDYARHNKAKVMKYRKSRHYRKRRYAKRRGFYSYTYRDTLPTYFDRQTQGAPFDSGFFFDSAIRPHGGNAPYMN